MKSINKNELFPNQITEIMESEKEVLRKITCPFAEQFYYSFQTNSKIHSITEYVEGINLAQLLSAKGKLNERTVHPRFR